MLNVRLICLLLLSRVNNYMKTINFQLLNDDRSILQIKIKKKKIKLIKYVKKRATCCS